MVQERVESGDRLALEAEEQKVNQRHYVNTVWERGRGGGREREERDRGRGKRRREEKKMTKEN